MKNIIDEQTYNNLDWHGVDPEQVDRALTGAVVLGAEPVGEPGMVDGVNICLRSVSGSTLSFFAGNDPVCDPDENPFMMEIAAVPVKDDREHLGYCLTPDIQQRMQADIDRWVQSLENP